MSGTPLSTAQVFTHDGNKFARADGTQATVLIPEPAPSGFIAAGVTVGENAPAADPISSPRIFIRRHAGTPPEYSEQNIGANKVLVAGRAECSKCGKRVSQAPGGLLYTRNLAGGRIDVSVERYCLECYQSSDG